MNELALHPALRDYWLGQLRTFGDERVWTSRARDLPAAKQSSASLIILALFMFSFALIAVGSVRNSAGTASLGGFLLAIVLIGTLLRLIVVQRTTSHTGVVNWRASSLVIGPAGLALAQGDLVGELRWAEVHGVKLKNSKAARDRRIELAVEGTQIRIADIYENSLEEIYQRIESYWAAG